MGVTLKRRPARARRRRLETTLVRAQDERARRIVDLAGATLLLILLAPVFLIGIAAVALSGRPIFFAHERLGRGGTHFRCWKLRTMQVDAEWQLNQQPQLHASYLQNGFKIPLKDDPRVTRIGRFLRCTYVDELPQVFNVLQGSMSLFGPRPIVPGELRNYGRRGAELVRVKPGLFGAWTSRGRERPSYPERAQLELDYVANRSFRRDVIILLRSIPAVLSGQPWS